MKHRTYIPVLLLIISAISCNLAAMADNNAPQGDESSSPTVVYQLFEYPVAPEELPDLVSKSDWIMRNFWNGMSLKERKSVDQNALNHAFEVYAAAMPWASREAVIEGSAKLLKQIEKNPVLLLQFTKAAEEALYGPRSNFWIDEVYSLYLNSVSSCKKIDPVRKVRYQDQLRRLSASAPGKYAPVFDYENRDGTIMKYFPMATHTIMIFGDPDCDDCRMGRLELISSVPLSRLIDQGKVNVMFIIPNAEEDWKAKVTNYPDKWIVGASDNADESYDLRATPSIFIIDGNGKIIEKNIPMKHAIQVTIDQFS